jgi:hypothetical protein
VAAIPLLFPETPSVEFCRAEQVTGGPPADGTGGGERLGGVKDPL